jgi:hypothetical protein
VEGRDEGSKERSYKGKRIKWNNAGKGKRREGRWRGGKKEKVNEEKK